MPAAKAKRGLMGNVGPLGRGKPEFLAEQCDGIAEGAEPKARGNPKDFEERAKE
jgi:hypothetical protein